MKKSCYTRFLLYRIEFFFLMFLGILFRALPEKWVYAFVRVLALLVFRVVRLRRGVTLENLRNSLGRELSEAELEKIAEAAYINIGMTFTEMLLFHAFVGHLRERVDMTETSLLERAFEKGRGVILVSGHFGNWELNYTMMGEAGYPMTVVAKKQSNLLVDEYINLTRRESNLRVVSHGAQVKHIIRALRNREVVGLISDQDAGKNGIFVDFFGRPASSPRGGAELALKYGIPILVTVTLRTAPGRYKALLREVKVYPEDTVKTLTQRYTTVLENIIRDHPEQYFWMHRRWKTQPSEPIDGEKSDGTGSAAAFGGAV